MDRVYPRVVPAPGQPVGPSGNPVQPHIAKQILEAVKTGEIERVQREMRMYTVELRDVTDPTQFFQNLLFAGSMIADQDRAIRMLTFLLEQGVDIRQKDNLKQTPLFYAAREGRHKAI